VILFELSGDKAFTDGIFSVTASQGPRQIAPAFNLSEQPAIDDRLGTVAFDALPTAPELLTIKLGGVTWECVRNCPSVILSTADGLRRTVQYVPKIVQTLKYCHDKPIHYISCPKEVKDHLTLDPEKVEIRWKESNQYPDNGWTVKEIIEDLGSFAGVRITCEMPFPLYVQNLDEVCDCSVSYKDLIDRYLPDIVEWVWFLANDRLHLTWIDPTDAIAQGDENYAVSQIQSDAPEVLPYTAWRIHGGMGQPNRTYIYDITTVAPYVKTEHKNAPYLKNGVSYPIWKTTVTQYDHFDKPFAVQSCTEEKHGDIFNFDGVTKFATNKVSATEMTYTYENIDPLIYAKPRLLSKTSTRSGYITKYYQGFTITSYGRVWFLTNKLDIIDYPTFVNMQTADPPTITTGNILISAVQEWVNDYEVIAETKDYVTWDEVTPAWFEGIEQSNSLKTTRLSTGILVSGGGVAVENLVYLDCLESAERVLQTVASVAKQATVQPPQITGVFLKMQELDWTQRTVRFLSKGQYEYQETRSRYDTASGKMEEIVEPPTIIGSDQLPATPTEYRKQALEIRSDMGKGQNQMILTVAVPTNNWEGLQKWGTLGKNKNLKPPQTKNYTAIQKMLYPGSKYAGRTVMAFSASETAGQGWNMGVTVQ
jgi:hypothetical protein